MKARIHISWLWWLLPLIPLLALPFALIPSTDIPTYTGFFGSIGGIIAWVVNRSKDAQKARSMLFLGISVPVLFLVFDLVIRAGS